MATEATSAMQGLHCDNREVVNLSEAANDADGEGDSCWTDEELFKPAPRYECPICMLLMPLEIRASVYNACCGKIICGGCVYAVRAAGDKRGLCPFCRTPGVEDQEYIKRVKKRAEKDDAEAINMLGCAYFGGEMGLRRNVEKASKLWIRAGKLGYALAYGKIAYSYSDGQGVERDEKKAKYYFELAAMGGDAVARHNLGVNEYRAGNMNRAVMHWMISAGAGDDVSLTAIRRCFLKGLATRDDFERALRSHKEAVDEMKSDQREAADAYREQNPDRFR